MELELQNLNIKIILSRKIYEQNLFTVNSNFLQIINLLFKVSLNFVLKNNMTQYNICKQNILASNNEQMA